jgi:hypothetical protein
MSYKIIQALKNLYVALGGTAANVADVTNTPDMINAIAALDLDAIADNAVTTDTIKDGNVTEAKLADGVKAKLNATELPAVTAEDNGSVLTVVEGAWAKVAPAPANNTSQTS